MPQHYIFETAITIDHELKEMRVDTTVRGIASKLARCGFKEIGNEKSLPYRRFIGDSDQIRFRKVKSARRTPPVGRKFGAESSAVPREREKNGAPR